MDDLRGFASPARAVGHPTERVALTGSTNDDARARARDGAAHGWTLVADAQTAGRGRAGRRWESPPGANLYVSFVLRPSLTPRDAPRVALAAGLAVADAVDRALGATRATVKWPNDVRVDGRKVAGVLVEGGLRGDALAWVVVGVGVNVKGEAPEAVRALATSVEAARGGEVSRAAVLADLCLAIERRVEALESGFDATRAELRRRCETLGRAVSLAGHEGVAEDIDDDGALLVRVASGALVTVHAGDVEPMGSAR